MRKWNLLIALMVLLLLSGCWSARELNDLAIATAIGIDKGESDEIKITVQILNPGEIAGKTKTSATPVTTYQTTDKTFFEAIRKLTTETPRKIYMSHLRVVIIGDEFAKDGINKILDFLSRDHEFRTDFLILVAKNNKAYEILNDLTPLENIPANKIYSSLTMSEKGWAPTKSVELDELIRDLVSKGKSPVLTGITVKGNEEQGNNIKNLETVPALATLRVTDLAVFKGDHLIGWFNTKESKGYSYITDNVQNTVGHFSCMNDGKVVIEVMKSKTELKGAVENNKPKIKVMIAAEGNIGEITCDADLSKPEIIKEMEDKWKKQLIDIIKTSIQKAQEDFQTDVFGFGEVIHRSNPKYWKTVEENWDEVFTTLDVSIETDLKIRRTGTIIESFLKDKGDQ